MSQPIADLYVRLSAPTTPLEADFAKATAAGDSMSTAVAEALGRIDASLGEMATAVQATATEFTAASGRMAASLAEVATGSAGMAGKVGESADGVAAANGRMAASFDQGVAAAKVEVEQIVAAQMELATRSAEVTGTLSAEQGQLAKAYLGAAASADRSATQTVGAFAAMSAKIEADLAGVKAAEGEAAVANDAVGASMAASADKSTVASATSSKSFLAIGAAAIGAAYETVKMAADFQQSTTRLVTGAGLVASSLGQVQQGILGISAQTGTSAEALSTAMYKVSSAGFNMAASANDGANGLKVLQAAAEGAKAGNADLTTVADAVSTALIDYHKNANDAADVTSKMVAAEQSGKMTFEEMAGALNAILPIASNAHISFNDIMGDLAAMTVHGISAQQAADNLADAVRHLQNPTAVQAKELATLGLNATEVSKNLGKQGLSGTIDEISNRITSQMGADGMVVLNLNKALSGLPPAVQALGREVLSGSASWKEWNTATKDLPEIQRSQATSFASLANSMHGVGTEAKSGSQVYQTYSAAMAKAMGDATGLKVALMVSGQNANIAAAAIRNVSGATSDASGNVRGWADIQGTFNQKLSEAKASFVALAISIGEQLLPTATAFIGKLSELAGWLTQHKTIAEVLAYTITAVLGVAIVGLTLKMLDLITRPIRALPGALADFATWIRRMTTSYGELDAAAATSATKRETAETGAANAADAAATRTQEAAVRMQTAYGEMATASELSRDRIVAADATAGAAAEGEALAGAGASAGGGLLGGLGKGALGLLGPVGAVVGGTLAVNDLTGGKLSQVVNKVTGGDAALAHSPHLLGGGAPAASAPKPATPPPAPKPPDYSKMFKAPPPVAGDHNDIRNLPKTVTDVSTAAGAAAKPVPHLDTLTKLPAATPQDIRGLSGIVSGAMTNTGKAVDAQSPGMAQKMKNAWSAFINFGPDKLGAALGDAAGDIATFAMKIAVPPPGFFQAGRNWGNKIGDGIKSIFVPSNDFFKSGKSVGDTIGHGLQVAFDPPQSFFDSGKKLGGKMFDVVKTSLNPGDSFFQIGRNVGQSFWNGVNNFWKTVDKEVGGLIDNFKQHFKDHFHMSSPSRDMYDIGYQVTQGLGNGFIDNWNNWLSKEVNKIPGFIKSAFSGGPSLLTNAGSSIVNGLWNGMKDAWNTVSGWISGLGSWISQHKGPVEADRQLLVPHGNAIMLGLIDGMRQQMPALGAQLEAVVATTQAAMRPLATAAAQPLIPLPQTAASGMLGASALPAVPPIPVSLPSAAPPLLSVPPISIPAMPASGLSGSTGAEGLPVPLPSGGGNTVVVNNHFHIAGSVISEQELYRIVQTQAQRHGNRNVSSGLNYSFGASR